MSFSSKAVFVKLAYGHEVDATTLLMLRMLFSLPIFLVIGIKSLRKKKKLEQTIQRKDWLFMIILGFSGYYVASIFDFTGLQYVSASLERLLLFVYPTIVVILSTFILKQPFVKEQLIALVLTYFGIFLAFWDRLQTPQEANFWIGVLWIFASAFTYACYLIGTEKVIPSVGVVPFTTIAMSVASVAIIIHFSIKNSWAALASLDAEVWYYSIILAIFCTVIPSFLVSKAISLIGSSNMSIVASVGPVTTILLAAWLLNEQVFALQLVGTAVVLAGVVFLSVNKSRKAKMQNDPTK